MHKVAPDHIIFAEAAGDYVKVQTDDQLIVTHSTFACFMEQLPDYFLQVHKSYVVNSNLIKVLQGNRLGIGNHTIPVGQTFKKAVRTHLGIE
ncbi:MAG: LytTR family DNA-binding domain-containing protein [Nonlabens sp.]